MSAPFPHPERRPGQAVRAALIAIALAAGTAGGATALAAGQTPLDAAQRKPYDIPAGPLGQTLSRFALQEGIALSFAPALTDGRQSPGASGSLTAQEAAARLLAGSGLELAPAAGGAYTLRPQPAPSPGVTSLQPIEVAARPESAWGPVQGYVATRSATGSKTDTPLLEIPQSVTVVAREQIEDTASRSLGQALRYSAGVLPQEGDDHTTDAFILRGFQVAGYSSAYRDGMKYMGNIYDGVQEPYGLERVEVLRGAASVLYGEAAPGGIINAVSKQPTLEPLHELRVDGGSYDRRQIATDHGGALDEAGKWSYRLTALARESGTMVDHVPDDRIYIAPALTWRPSSRTSLTLQGTYQHSETAYVYGLPPEGTILPNPNGRIPTRRFIGEPGYDKADVTFRDIGYRFEHAFNDTLKVRQNLRYFSARNDMPSAWAAGFVPGSDMREIMRGAQDRVDESSNFVVDTQVQADLRHGAFAHTVLAGVDYSDRNHRTERYNRTLAPLDLYSPQYGGALGPAEPALNSSDTDTRRMGVYLQDQAKIAGKWVVLLGGRYDWARDTSRALFMDMQDTERSEAFTVRAGLVYLADNGLAPFVSFSQSFEPTSGTARDGSRFEPTEGEQYELGLRYQPPGSNMLLSASVYQLTQTNVLTPDPVDPAFYQVQTGEVRSRGVELEAQLPVGRDLRLVAAYAYTDAVTTRSNNPDEVDQQRGGVPRHMASLWADYRLTALGLPQARLGAGVRYVGDSTGLFAAGYEVPSYTVVDAMASYETGPWTFTLNANNLADRKYVASYTYGAFYGQRRTVTASLSYRW